jgi:hypothetical protein
MTPQALLPNNPIKLSVRPVTQLACASCAPVWPAAYRVRWTDPNNSEPEEGRWR